jgi:ribosome biogenesis GTPase A
MAKSLHGLDAYIKKCDVIFYVLDARCPRSCINPEFTQFIKRKPVIFVLNKYDLALPVKFEYLIKAPQAKDPAPAPVVVINSKQNNAADKIIPYLKKLFPNKTLIHAMVIGVPNSGKSTLINNFAAASKAKAEDRAGVTRTPQWVLAQNTQKFSLYLLDTPGLLYPNLSDEQSAINLALVGSIRDDVLDIVELVRTRIDLEDFAQTRGCIRAGGELDLERAAKAYLTDFRSGKFGKVHLE